MSERKMITVDVWLIQYSADCTSGLPSGVRPDGCIKPTAEKAKEYAAEIAKLPWISAISITKLQQTIPLVPLHDTSDASVLGWMAGGDLERRH